MKYEREGRVMNKDQRFLPKGVMGEFRKKRGGSVGDGIIKDPSIVAERVAERRGIGFFEFTR